MPVDSEVAPVKPRRPWPDPTPEMLCDPRFQAVWEVIKGWEINVPDVYTGYCGATGNHVRAIVDAWMNAMMAMHRASNSQASSAGKAEETA